ncbi:MAG: type II secretion system GspH family protein [Candidatus Omnitrophica bacterium]|nr:type II secretion system GspH family protein [Candidatus Omnitrophota bacterium]
MERRTQDIYKANSNTNTSSLKINYGLTLVEMVISLTISATIGVIIVSIFLSSNSFYEMEKSFAKIQAQVTNALTLIEKSLYRGSNFIIYDSAIYNSGNNNITYGNPTLTDGTAIKIIDNKGTPNDRNDDETIWFFKEGSNLFYWSSQYGLKLLGTSFNTVFFSQLSNLVKVNLSVNCPTVGILEYRTSVIPRNIEM